MRWQIKMQYRQAREGFLSWLARRIPKPVGYYVVVKATADYSIECEPTTEMAAITAMNVLKSLGEGGAGQQR